MKLKVFAAVNNRTQVSTTRQTDNQTRSSPFDRHPSGHKDQSSGCMVCVKCIKIAFIYCTDLFPQLQLLPVQSTREHQSLIEMPVKWSAIKLNHSIWLQLNCNRAISARTLLSLAPIACSLNYSQGKSLNQRTADWFRVRSCPDRFQQPLL